MFKMTVDENLINNDQFGDKCMSYKVVIRSDSIRRFKVKKVIGGFEHVWNVSLDQNVT